VDIKELLISTKQFAKTLYGPISTHVEKHGMIVVGNNILIAYDPNSGRIVITFAIQQTLPIEMAAAE
jgi:hypothetical protein